MHYAFILSLSSKGGGERVSRCRRKEMFFGKKRVRNIIEAFLFSPQSSFYVWERWACNKFTYNYASLSAPEASWWCKKCFPGAYNIENLEEIKIAISAQRQSKFKEMHITRRMWQTTWRNKWQSHWISRVRKSWIKEDHVLFGLENLTRKAQCNTKNVWQHNQNQ